MLEKLPIQVYGHAKITDDLGAVLLDKKNAVHPQNLARVIARALANEHNFFVHRIAFGNGGTVVDAAFQIKFNSPNDGIRDGQGWQSRLYNETYSEIIDESNIKVKTGVGTDPSNDPPTSEHTLGGPGVVSQELGLTSQVVITCVLNPNEPTGQAATDTTTVGGTIFDTEGDFVFDEIGLYTTGSPNVAKSGYQDVNVGTKLSIDDTGLFPNTAYTFQIKVDGGATQTVNITTPATGSGTAGEILYSDLVNALNGGTWGGALSGVSVTISQPDTTPGADAHIQTYGLLHFKSSTTGALSTVVLVIPFGAPPYPGNYLFSNLVGFVGFETAVDGEDQGVDNQPTQYAKERERLLTHLLFSPVAKSSNRTLTIVYTLTIAVAQTP